MGGTTHRTLTSLERQSAQIFNGCPRPDELECRLVTNPANPAEWVSLRSDYFTPTSVAVSAVWNLATRHGLLDISFAPSAFPDGYAELSQRAGQQHVAGRLRLTNAKAHRAARSARSA